LKLIKERRQKTTKQDLKKGKVREKCALNHYERPTKEKADVITFTKHRKPTTEGRNWQKGESGKFAMTAGSQSRDNMTNLRVKGSRKS